MKVEKTISENIVQTTMRMTKDMHQKLKMLASAKNLKIYEITYVAMEEYIKANEHILKNFLETEECE